MENVPDRAVGPDIAVLYCRRCTAPNADPEQVSPKASGLKVRFVILPCSSKVERSHIFRILEKGADGVQVVGCPEDSCRFLTGSRMAQKRIHRARSLLAEIGLGAERVGMERGAGLEAGDLLELAAMRAEAVRSLGSNPMKGVKGA